MDCTRLCTRARYSTSNRFSGSTPSEESTLDTERNCCDHPSPQTLQPFPSAWAAFESSAAYFSWPSWQLSDAAEERENYLQTFRKGFFRTLGRLPKGERANSLLELMTIRAFHSKILRCYSLCIAVGFRIRRGVLTDIPAILVFVSRKVHKQWLNPIQCLSNALEVSMEMFLVMFSFSI
ncbi:Trypsin family protein [Euphorbia peplus]|nr:Trypsin family protein [Euphorbia peplus]